MRLLLLLALTAVAAPPSTPNEAAAIAKADAAALKVGKTLKDRLGAAMGGGGPVAAIGVCTNEAQLLTATVGAEAGVTVGRSSLRTRNPANIPPDWVATWLAQQGERKAEGVSPYSGIEQGPTGKVARVIRPIAIEQACLTCHGDPKAMNPGVLAILKDKYQDDVAKGYQVGDLRGALWAEAAVP